ncbi:MAG: pilus assembly protein PilY, partial [Burkholderiales bacterium]|nr:pilus assembly protein PilY [Burkholderiales bacterium]
GGQGLYALDITNPANFSQGGASALVVKEINLSNLTCANNANCKNDLGYSYGTPIIRRMHNGDWAVIFGNGYNSSTGTAAMFIATVKNGASGTNPSGQTGAIYELDTGAGPSSDPTGQHRANGINYVASADLDGDHVIDYLYAGDLFGNLWRFDVSGCNPPGVTTTGCAASGGWTVSKFGGTAAKALFSAKNASSTVQPITTQVQVLSVPSRVGQPRITVMFGTGKNIETADQLPNNSPTGVQSIYGVWDWDMNGWNAQSQAQYASLSGTQSMDRSVMQQQTVQGAYDTTGQAFGGTGTGYRTLTTNPVCWKNSSSCPSNNNQLGFYLDLPSSGESIIYNPTLAFGTFIVNSTIPSPNSQGLSCYAPAPPGGWTMAINPLNGGALPNSFFADSIGNFVTIGGQIVSGTYLNAVGSPSLVTYQGKPYMINQDNSGNPNVQQVNPAPNGTGQRLTWTELR